MIRTVVIPLALGSFLLAGPAIAQEDGKKEVISFSGSGDGPIKTVDKDGTVEETDARSLNNINVIPGFSGPKYTFDDDSNPGRSGGNARTGSATNPSRSGRASSADKEAQAARIDEMLENRKRHVRRAQSNGKRPPQKR